MHLIYIDDSNDPPLYTFSAIAIPDEKWRTTFDAVREFRRRIRVSDGIYVRKELHATDFVAGRGNIADRIVTKFRRSEIFKEVLSLLANQVGVRVFNVALKSREEWAFERLLNRINRSMVEYNSRAILICDEGKESEYIKLVRRMGVYNPIPSRYGVWQDTGDMSRNIPIERIIEDPFFKQSFRSNFIQIADFCAYALLRKEQPLPSKSQYGFDRAFEILKPVCVLEANPRDEFGIIR